MKTIRRQNLIAVALICTSLALVAAGFTHVAVAQEIPTEADVKRLQQRKPEYSPYVDQHFPNRVFWGDTHHHSNFSFDDGLAGTKLTPEESYRFARGEELISNTGLRVKLSRPLDFLNVSDAMQRKEVYGTTGPRITVRVFAGWDFQADEVERPDFAAQGYRRGVPMGGDLKSAPAGKAPTFMVRTLRDPDGANLDRIQIIKGWLDPKGDVHEHIYDVAVSDGRKIGADGRCKTSVGSTVEVPNATYKNTIGDPLLAAYWKDPEFDGKQRAFYYMRVIQILTPRWTAYDCQRFGMKMPDYVPMTVTDRAYTSPIWYTPGK